VRCDACQLNLTSLSWTNGKVMKEWNAPLFSMNVSDARLVYSISENDFLFVSGCENMNDCVLTWTVGDGKGAMLSSSYMFVGSPKDVVSKDPELSIKSVVPSNNADEYEITLTTTGVAAFVWLETKLDGYFSDNGMLMVPGEEKNVVFKSRDSKKTLADVTSGVYVYSLFDAGGFKQ